MSLDIYIIGLVVAGLLSYIVTKVNKQAGALVTIIATIVSFVFLLKYRESLVFDSIIPLFDFKSTPLALFFSLIMIFIYANVAFFNPNWMKKYNNPAAYNMFFMLSLAGTIGMFFSQNFMSLFIFFEFVVWTSMFILPMGKSRNAATIYYVMSAFGSFVLLFGILFLYTQAGTFNIVEGLTFLQGNLTVSVVVYITFAIAALVKLGVFPFHIWLPMAHSSAPDTFSPILSGGLVKAGAFVGFFLTILYSDTSAATTTFYGVANYILMVLGAISVIIGTLQAIRQDDAKKLLAYSSVANGGYIIIGLASGHYIGIGGALMHIFAHAIATAAAFLAIIAVKHRTGTSKISELGGIIHKMPISYVVYLMAIISLAGIPPMAGFISKWLLYQTLIDQGYVFISVAAFFGSLGSFLYVFRPLAGLFLGQELPEYKKIKEAPILMIIPMIILSLATLYYGIFPNSVLAYINEVLVSADFEAIKLGAFIIHGANGILNPTLIAIVFGLGVFVIFIIFMILPKSRKVDLMDNYTSSEFIYTESLMHYSADFYAPFERLYENGPKILVLYKKLVYKIKELGILVRTLFFSNRPELSVFWIIVVILLALWGVNYGI